jgi:hypothetical protein
VHDSHKVVPIKKTLGNTQKKIIPINVNIPRFIKKYDSKKLGKTEGLEGSQMNNCVCVT